MAWKRDPKYHTPEHRRQRAAYEQQLERDGYLECAQPVCIEPTRVILPGMKWAAGHDASGLHYIGPVHKACNDHDARRRGIAAANGKPVAEVNVVDSWFA